jgi:allophanate hydrolase subunit 2
MVFKVDSIARSGVRLSNDKPLFKNTFKNLDLLSLPVFPGVIQITKNGDPIILCPDSGVTGGYPVLETVPISYLHLLSRLSNGQDIRLKKIDYSNSSYNFEPLSLGSLAW